MQINKVFNTLIATAIDFLFFFLFKTLNSHQLLSCLTFRLANAGHLTHNFLNDSVTELLESLPLLDLRFGCAFVLLNGSLRYFIIYITVYQPID